MRYTTELVLRRIDECHCDQCGALVRVGDRVTWELATGAGFCSMECARAGDKRGTAGTAARIEFYPTENG